MEKKILVVDDNLSFRVVIGQLLKDGGYSISTAEDGISALRTLENKRFDILITDINMPNMNGIELFKNVKKLYPQIIVIFMSGFDYSDLYEKLLREGASYFFKKPFDLNLLKRTIKHILDTKYSQSKINVL